MKNLELKTVASKVLRDSEVKVKNYPKQGVRNKYKTYYNTKARSKKKTCKTNLSQPIRVRVPKSKIDFDTNGLKGKNKATTAPGWWLFITLKKKKENIPNLNYERGKRYGILKKPER